MGAGFTDNLINDEVRDGLEITGLEYRVVVTAIRKVFPHFSGRPADREELLHMCRSTRRASARRDNSRLLESGTYGTISSLSPLKKSTGVSVIRAIAHSLGQI